MYICHLRVLLWEAHSTIDLWDLTTLVHGQRHACLLEDLILGLSTMSYHAQDCLFIVYRVG